MKRIPMTQLLQQPQPKDNLTVAMVVHPFAVERIHQAYPAGQTLACIIQTLQPDPVLASYAHVYIDGHYILPQHWARVKPQAGTIVSIRMVPRGGDGGKNPLRTVLSLALIAASPMIAGAVAGALGGVASAGFMGITVGRIVTAGVNLLGRLALNALAPPGKPRFGTGLKESPTLFLQGARNQAYPFARVPRVLGRHRFVPPLGAQPYTETVGNDQYIRMLFVWGYGPLHITDIKIGETPIGEFDGVDIETRQGFADDAPITLYSNSVMQNDMEVTLRESDSYTLRTTDFDADEISVDITLPRGLVRFAGNGSKQTTTVQLEVQYSPAGEDDWSAGAFSFKSIAGASLALPAPPAAYRTASGISPVIRIDRIFQDPASGALKCISGATVRTALDTQEPEVPQAPAGFIPLARILRRSGDSAVIAGGDITDERDSTTIAKYFETSDDFTVTASLSANGINIASGGLSYPGLVLSAKQSSALRHSVSFKVPRGRYDVRVRRITLDSTDDNTFDEAVWTALRSTRYSYPVNMTGLALTALRIKATDQLNGIVERLNGIVHSILPDWDGENWVPQVTSNPAALFRHVLQGNGNARPLSDARLDLARLQEWHGHCATAQREFNAVIDYDVSVREVLQDIAAAGRASPTLLDGKWAVVEDQIQSVPVQHFTPYNTFGFQGRKSFDDMPEALRVRFINRDKGWLQDERLVFRDGFDATTATQYETLTFTGITSADEAWRHGRYHLASAQLRPETFSFYCDIEHIVCTRGDLIRFTHDVPMFGLAASRIATLILDENIPAQIIGVTLESTVTMQAEQNYAVRFRTQDGTSVVVALETQEGSTTELVFSTPQPISCGIATGNLALFGEAGQESACLIVKSIEPQNDLNARLTCVDAAPAVYAADTGVVPPYHSQMSIPQALQRPPAPQLAGIQSGSNALIRHADGSVTSRILINLQPPAFAGLVELQAHIRAKDESVFKPADVLTQNATHISLTNVTEGDIYDIRLRYRTDGSILSPALTIADYTVAGTTEPPPVVENFYMNILEATAYLSWQRVSDIDLSHYTLRFSPDTEDVEWHSATDVITVIPAATTTVAVPARAGTYLIKAVDNGGRLSAEDARIVTNITGLSHYDALWQAEESPVFAGVTSHTVISDDCLMLAEGVQAGQYVFAQTIDLGNVYTNLLTATLNASGLDRAETSDDWPNVDAVENRDGNLDPSQWQVTLQVRTTNDDPFLAPACESTAPNTLTDTDWSKTNTTINSLALSAPVFDTDADVLTEDSSTNMHALSQPTTQAENAVCTLNCCIKADGRSVAAVFVSKSATTQDNAFGIGVNLTDGSLSDPYTAGTATVDDAGIENIGNGWFRIFVTGTVDAGGGSSPVFVQIHLRDTDSMAPVAYAGDGVSGIGIYAAQLVAGDTPPAANWSGWRNFLLGEYTARACQFRAVLSSAASNMTPVITALGVKVDMPERHTSLAGLTSDPAGNDIVFAKAFRATPAIAITAQDMTSGDYYTITDVSESGFSIRFFNAASSGVTRHFDYMAKGFGEKI